MGRANRASSSRSSLVRRRWTPPNADVRGTFHGRSEQTTHTSEAAAAWPWVVCMRPWAWKGQAVESTLVHFGAVVADAPSPLSTPRSATGQAQLRLGKPLRMKCRASPVLLFMRAGRVVAGTVGIVRATVPFHGEHDALEPTKEG